MDALASACDGLASIPRNLRCLSQMLAMNQARSPKPIAPKADKLPACAGVFDHFNVGKNTPVAGPRGIEPLFPG